MASTVDPKSLKRAADREKVEALFESEATKFVMSDARGRRFVSGILEFCNPLKSAFDLNGSKTYLNLGQQNVGLMIFAKLEATCPELFLEMRREKLAREDQGNG